MMGYTKADDNKYYIYNSSVLLHVPRGEYILEYRHPNNK